LKLVPCLVIAAAFAGNSLADSYPSRPVKVVVPWPPGQATDVAARAVAEGFSTVFGQPFVIENRPGAAGTIGTEFAARAAPDGYTILAGSSGPLSVSPNVQKVGYDPRRDFEPICLLSSTSYVLVTGPSVPVTSVNDLISLLRASPGKYTFASGGTASTTHLVVEAFNRAAKVTAIHVPYKGSAPALTDVIAGHVTYTMETSAAVLPHVKAGRLKALGLSSPIGAVGLPNLPMIAEAANLPGFDLRGWIGLLVPAGVSPDQRVRLTAECQKALQSPEMKERFLSLGLEAANLPASEFANFMMQQSERYGSVAREASIRAD